MIISTWLSALRTAARWRVCDVLTQGRLFLRNPYLAKLC